MSGHIQEARIGMGLMSGDINDGMRLHHDATSVIAAVGSERWALKLEGSSDAAQRIE